MIISLYATLKKVEEVAVGSTVQFGPSLAGSLGIGSRFDIEAIARSLGQRVHGTDCNCEFCRGLIHALNGGVFSSKHP